MKRDTDHDTFQEKLNALTAAFVAISVVIMVGVTTFYLLTHEIPVSNQTIVGQLQGSLWTSLGVIVAFYYVSSASSRKKDDTIALQAQTASVAQSALAPLATSNPDTIVLKPGEAATATATEAGTIIEPEIKP
jgi:hypothetical protein